MSAEWQVSIACFDAVEKRKISFLNRTPTPRLPPRSLISNVTEITELSTCIQDVLDGIHISVPILT
jgi:hypothetical protein